MVSDLVSAAGVSYRAGNTKAMLPRDDQYVPNGKYLRLSAATTSRRPAPVEDIPSSTPQAPTIDEIALADNQKIGSARTESEVKRAP